MRVAAILPCLPEPRDAGVYQRSAAMLAMLGRLGAVDCCCLIDRPPAPGAVDSVRARVARLHAVAPAMQPWKPLRDQLADPLPPNVRHWYDPAIVAGVRAFFAGRRYDVVYLGDLVSLPYAEAAGLDRFPCWLDRNRVDIEYQRQVDAQEAAKRSWTQRETAALRRRLTAAYERHAATVCAGEVVCAESDARALRACVGDAAEIAVVANGIDRTQFTDQGPLPDDPVALFAGGLAYLPNADGIAWFLDACWGQVRARLPQARLLVVGRDPPEALRARDGQDGVTVTGAVPSMLPWYRQARAVVVPIRIGGGTRLKVVEAWALGRPLVGTSIGVDGLAARHGGNCLIADDAGAFADATCRLLAGGEADRLRLGALAAGAAYSWETVTAPLAERWRSRYGGGWA